jgi:hypothetical protein
METNTLIDVVAMLDKQIWNLTYEHSDLQLFMIAHDYSATEIKEATELHKAKKQALVDFRDRLQDAIDSEVASMETSMGM